MSNVFVVAAAQSVSVKGDVCRNVERHLVFMREAAERGARLVIFPELSLTGYESAIAHEIAIDDNDACLEPLRQACAMSGLTVVVGAPLRFDDAVRIGALTFKPNGSTRIYTKQYLHAGEEAVFSPGSGGELISIDGKTVALAVCADTGHPEHAARAAERGAALYAAGVLITTNGYAANTALLQQYATRHRFSVLMANHGGETGGWSPAGRSTFWDENGILVATSSGTGEALVIATRSGTGWTGEVIALHTMLSRL